MLDRAFPRIALASGASVVVLIASACSHPSQVSFVSNEQPISHGGAQGLGSPSAAHAGNPNGGASELPNDDVESEPERPAAGSKQERSLVHIHGPDGLTCSGVMLGPRLVATAQRCVRGEAKGAKEISAAREYRVEIASSTLTWTNRRARWTVVPDCRWSELDIAILVLAEAATWVEPMKIASAPGPGAKVQALGFGHCAGQKETFKDRIGTVRNRNSESVVIDVPLCKGDAGGPVVDGSDIVGLISRRDDPDGSPLRTTTIARLDTANARDLIAQATKVADGTDATTLHSVACK